MFSIQKHALTKKISNLIKRINIYIKILKTLILFVQSLYQNWTDLSCLGVTGQRVLRYIRTRK